MKPTNHNGHSAATESARETIKQSKKERDLARASAMGNDQLIESLREEMAHVYKCNGELNRKLTEERETIERLTRERNEALGYIPEGYKVAFDGLPEQVRQAVIRAQAFLSQRDTLQSDLAKAREEKEKAIDDWQSQVNEQRERLKRAQGWLDASRKEAQEAREEITRLKAIGRTREVLGRRVREIWIAWARAQPTPKPSWLVEWDDLSEPDREVDRQIGETIAREQTASLRAELSAAREERDLIQRDHNIRVTQLVEERDNAMRCNGELHQKLSTANACAEIAALETMREVLLAADIYIPMTQSCAVWRKERDLALALSLTLSLTPSTALRDHDLKLAERAFNEGCTYGAGGERHWLASDIRAKLTGGKENA